MQFRGAGALTAAFMLSGCISSGTQVSDQQIDRLQKGKTTEAEVIARMGPPDMTERSASGDRVDIYNYMKEAMQWQSFIPVVGSFVAGTDTTAKILRLTFNRQGVLTDWTVAGSAGSIATGVANQK